jgi:LPS export ABC transporter protein LptC
MRIRAFLLLPMLAAVTACQPDTTTPVSRSIGELPADQIIIGLVHVMTNEGVRKAYLRGDTAFVRDEGRVFEITGVKLEFFDDSGNGAGELTSTAGEYSPASGTFVAKGSVVLNMKGPQGNRRLETEELHYEPNINQIASPVPFVMREGGRVQRGQSFRSDTQFRNYTVQGAQGSIPSGAITF